MEEQGSTPTKSVRAPAPTASPMLLALGIALAFAGLVTSGAVSLVGIVVGIFGAVTWFGDVLPVEDEELIVVQPTTAAIVPAKAGIDYLRVGEHFNRAVLPIAIHPYSAGIKGGIAGGFVMAALAVMHGILIHGSPWYTINILAATAMTDLAHANTATLSAFNPTAFGFALVIHGIASLLVGLLYGVMLPMCPRYPALFAAVIAPLLWSGLLWASLGVINPVLDQRIEWKWFILCQIAFGAVAGYVVDRTEKVRTLQHLPFALRTGIEARFEGDDPQKGGGR